MDATQQQVYTYTARKFRLLGCHIYKITSNPVILEDNVKMWCTVSTNVIRNCFHSHQYLARCAREVPQEVLSSCKVCYCCPILTKTKMWLKDFKTIFRLRISFKSVKRFLSNQLWHGQKDRHDAQGRIRSGPARQLSWPPKYKGSWDITGIIINMGPLNSGFYTQLLTRDGSVR